MLVEIWSDVVCPWCYLGERRFELAVAEFEHGAEIEVRRRSFQLDPRTPDEVPGDQAARIAHKYGIPVEQARALHERIAGLGAEVGLDFRFDQVRTANSFDAHRVLHLAAARDLQAEVAHRLMAAHFTEGALISDHETLVRVGAEAGLEAAEITAVLSSDAYAADVRDDRGQAVELGISGVPHFLVDGRFAIPGAQSVDTMLGVLRRAWDRASRT